MPIESFLVEQEPIINLVDEELKVYNKPIISNEIVLGTTQPYGRGKLSGIIKLDNERKVILVVGGQGSGKSSTTSRVFEEARYKGGIPWLIIDPQHEYATHKKPLEKQFVGPLERHHPEIVGRPMGLKNTVIITPNTLKHDVSETDLVSSIHLKDFFDITDRQFATNLLMELLEIKAAGFSAARRQFSFVVEAIRNSRNPTFKSLSFQVDKYLKRGFGPEGKKNSYVIKEKIDSLRNGGIVEVENTVGCSVWEYLAQGKNVILQTSLSETEVTEDDVQIALMIYSVVQNSWRFPNGVGIFADELENIVSRERKKSELRSLMMKVPKKYRQRNIWIVGLTQVPSDVHASFVNQADVLMFSRMDQEQMTYMFKNSKIDSNIADINFDLLSRKAPESEWLMTFPYRSRVGARDILETVYERFFALPPRGQFRFKKKAEVETYA